jgi:hypothetical protein
MAFHNLCIDIKPPPSIANLLGLGLKYCIKTPKNLDELIKKLQWTIRLHFNFLDEDMEETDSANTELDAHTTCIPSLYIPSEWQPQPADNDIKATLAILDSKLNELKCRLPKICHYNLTQPCSNNEQALWTCNDLIVSPTDKNLGPSIAARSD